MLLVHLFQTCSQGACRTLKIFDQFTIMHGLSRGVAVHMEYTPMTLAYSNGTPFWRGWRAIEWLSVAADNDNVGDTDCDGLDWGIHLKCHWAWAVGWGWWAFYRRCYVLGECSAPLEHGGCNSDAELSACAASASGTLWEHLVHDCKNDTGLWRCGRCPRHTRWFWGDLQVLQQTTRLTQELRPKV